MDVVKYQNGREVKVGDQVVSRCSSDPNSRPVAGTVIGVELEDLVVVPGDAKVRYITPKNCLHVEDAFAARDPVLPVGGTGVGTERPAEPTAKGSESGGTPPPTEQPSPEVKAGPKPGEEGGPAIIASE